MSDRIPWYDKIEKVLIIILFIIMTIILFINVVTRFGFSYTASWTEQAARILFTWMTFCGVSLAGLQGAHLQVTVATMVFGERHAQIVFKIGNVISILFGFFLSYKIFCVMRTTMVTHQTFPSIPWLPTWVLYLSGVLGTLGFSVRVIEREFRSLRTAENEKEVKGQ